MIRPLIVVLLLTLTPLLLPSPSFAIESNATGDAKESLLLEKNFTLLKKISVKGRLAFTATIDGDRRIIEVDLHSGRFRTLVNSAKGSDWYSDYNPHGNKIAFVSNRTGGKAIHIASWDGTRQKRLTRSEFAEGDPDWNPRKGKEEIVFYRERSATSRDSHLVSINLTSKRETKLTKLPMRNVTPRYSFDGKQVAFSTNFNWPGWDVCLVKIGNQNTSCILKGVESFCRPAWSPDGSRLVYSLGLGDKVFLSEYTAGGSSRDDIVTLSGKSYDAHFDKSGKLLFFASNSSGSFNIYVRKLGKVHPLITSPYSLRYPTHHPNNLMDQEVKRLKGKGSKK